MILKAYKYRLYPTPEQAQVFAQHFGVARWCYNYALVRKKNSYETSKTDVKVGDIAKEIRLLKKQEETKWLAEPNDRIIDFALQNLNTAFSNFFRRVKQGADKAGYPRFKSRKNGHQSFQFDRGYKIDFTNFDAGQKQCMLSVPKLKNIPIVVDRKFEGVTRTATISRTPSGKYFISILVETVDTLPEKLPIVEETTIGLDLGIKDFVVTSEGKRFANPHLLRKNLERLAVLQRRASRKQKGSANRKKANLKVARLHERIMNQREYYIHSVVNEIVNDNQVCSIALENLNVKGMMKNHNLALAIGEIGWHRFNLVLEYKAAWQGKNIIRIGRFEPSSKTCCKCGHVYKELELKHRTWQCAGCGIIHDRDQNAAQNIKQFALRNSGVFNSVEPFESSAIAGALKKESKSDVARTG